MTIDWANSVIVIQSSDNKKAFRRVVPNSGDKVPASKRCFRRGSPGFVQKSSAGMLGKSMLISHWDGGSDELLSVRRRVSILLSLPSFHSLFGLDLQRLSPL